MIRKCMCLFMVLSLLQSSIVNAYADVIFEPSTSNNFYSKNRNSCETLNRNFYANSEDGYVSFKKEPGSKSETAALENGATINIIVTYNYMGELWGFAELKNNKSGWAPMDQFLVVYNYLSFAEEHEDEFYEYTGSYENLRETDHIVLWSWPGSGTTAGSIEPSDIDEYFSVSAAYKDDEGREWGFASYWRGRRNSWICLSDPSNEEIPAFNPPPQPELWESVKPGIANNFALLPVAVGLVAVLVVGTAILIHIFWKRRD